MYTVKFICNREYKNTYVQFFDGFFVISLVYKIHNNGRSGQKEENNKTEEVDANSLHPPYSWRYRQVCPEKENEAFYFASQVSLQIWSNYGIFL